MSPRAVMVGGTTLTLAEAMESLVLAAATSGCKKSQRGALLLGRDGQSYFGANAPVVGRCDGSEECRRDCSKICVHAEQAALLIAGKQAEGGEMFHVKIVAGQAVTSGDPSCVQCSKLMLVAGVRGVWLYQESGWRRWSAEAFHRATLLKLELHGARFDGPEPCPSSDCPACTGEVCRKCGAGRTRNPMLDGKPCHHDVLERHEEPRRR